MDIREIHGHGYSAKINISRGANCISLRHAPTESVILREPPECEELDNPFLYGMPILFPVNRIDGGCFNFDGRHYQFPINEEKTGCTLHGELHSYTFRCIAQTESSLTAIYRADTDEYIGFPHAFEIEIKYSITRDGLTQSTTVRNLSDSNMPCLIGFHTTFKSLPHEGSATSRVLVDVEREFERSVDRFLPTGVCPEPDAVTDALRNGILDPLNAPITRHYKAGGEMRIEIRTDRARIIYENSKNMPFRLIYNGDAKEFICLEPQTSLANSPSSPFSREEAGFNYIPAHSEQTFVSKISVKEN